jgi:hypothetical protein
MYRSDTKIKKYLVDTKVFKGKKVKRIMARMHLFLDKDTAKKIKKLKKALNERFAVDVVKKLIDFAGFYAWLQEQKPEEFSKLWLEYTQFVKGIKEDKVLANKPKNQST